jgi:hypothetical protein
MASQMENVHGKTSHKDTPRIIMTQTLFKKNYTNIYNIILVLIISQKYVLIVKLFDINIFSKFDPD